MGTVQTNIYHYTKYNSNQLEQNFSGSNTDGSFTMDVSNSFLSPEEKVPWLQVWDTLVPFSFYIENGILCALIRIASVRRL